MPTCCASRPPGIVRRSSVSTAASRWIGVRRESNGTRARKGCVRRRCIRTPISSSSPPPATRASSRRSPRCERARSSHWRTKRRLSARV